MWAYKNIIEKQMGPFLKTSPRPQAGPLIALKRLRIFLIYT
jgi:hypothetical protein